MNSHQTVSRITDVVPANFLCDNQTMQKIADSQLSDEKALSLLKANLSVLESRQQRLKDELASVEQLISEAVSEQTRLRSSIETHKSLLAYTPVRALPGEVLSEIFLHYIAISQPTRGSVFKEIVACYSIRARILQVCRRWRTTALADPHLWTTIPLIGSGQQFFDDEEGTDDEEEKSFAHPMISGSPQERTAYWKVLEGRIKRTSSLPLQLLFHYDDYGSIGNCNDTISSLKTFIRLFPRANTISLHIDDSQRLSEEFRSFMDNVDIPHTHGVHTAGVDVSDEVFGRRIVSAIPSVEVLATTTRIVDQWFTGASTAGHCLRSLHILDDCFAIPFLQVLDLLDRAPLLETLKLAGISIMPSVGTLRVVTHTLLSTFHLPSVTAEENDAVFEHLTLPALRSLSFGVKNDPYCWPRPSNLSFLQRSHCMLTELGFCHCLVDEQPLVALLTAQSKLTTLLLNFSADDAVGRGAPIPTPILDFLSKKPKGASAYHVPALTVLKVSVLPRQLKAVKRMIQSRSTAQAKKSGIATLKEVDIDVQTKQSEVDIKKDEHTALFKAFTDKGMAIRISYRYVY
ncbi:hypothetical protein CPB85DRAFT_572207 [Mucidula mucida]|nr:hypothetical protein CPB85DRAFT_572207 [Mucidula mucida]